LADVHRAAQETLVHSGLLSTIFSPRARR
jgi:hypothetical protein